jgi:dynein light chain roadblock-type
VTGVIVMNHEGVPLKSSLDSTTTAQYTAGVGRLALLASSIVRDLDPNNQIRFMRIKSIKHEVNVGETKLTLIFPSGFGGSRDGLYPDGAAGEGRGLRGGPRAEG